MSVLEIILGAAIFLTAILIIIFVLLQEGHQQGLSGAIAGGAETFFGKNKGRTLENKLVKGTAVLAVIFFVLALATTLMLLFLR